MASHDILVVDDSRMVVALVSDILQSSGYNVRKAENGRIALDMVRDKKPDLVLLDVMMPEMDGYEVCKALRTEHEYIPVLMLTAKDEIEDLVSGLDAGADDYISKPFDQVELLARVKSLLRIRTLQKKLYMQNLELEAKNQELETLANQLDALNRELKILSVTDGLTKAYNRRYFQDRMRTDFARASRHLEPLSCIMLDIDHFKAVNDAHGHPTGDRVLVRLVEIIKGEVRNEDIVARYGGEEFVLVLPQTASDSANKLAERIRQRVENEAIPLCDGKLLNFTVSLGVAEYNQNKQIQTSDDLLQAADAALYKAKTSGRNRVVIS